MLIDIGCNLTARAFRPDVDGVIARARAAGVDRMIVTGLTAELSWAAHRLAERYPGVLSSTAGVHPHNARTYNRTTTGELRRLAARDQVVAIGECGLDYNRNFSPPDAQREAFTAQLEPRRPRSASRSSSTSATPARTSPRSSESTAPP